MKYLYIFLPLLLISLSVFSKPQYLLKHVEETSRDYFYIDVNQDAPSYEQQSMVGGEHETHYLLLGFAGDRFKIVITSEDKYVGYVVRDESYVIESKVWDDEEQTATVIVRVNYQQTWVDVSLSAHPVADYHIDVSRLATSKR